MESSRKKDCMCTISYKHATCVGECLGSSNRETSQSQRIHQRSSNTYKAFVEKDDFEEEDDYLNPDDIAEEFKRMMPDPISRSNRNRGIPSRSRLSNDSDLLQRNRNSLRKFEALNIGGLKLTEMSIGGYNVDLEKVAQKAIEVLPMPASKLPIIFVDKDLNFYHHFFQAIGRELGSNQMLEIVSSSRHYDDSSKVLLRCVEDLILRGYEKSDDELTLLLKKVMGGTFESSSKLRSYHDGNELTVVANLWGFEYIEPGMQCSEADLKMWLSMCYSHYRTIWFNTFKSTGVPEFAKDGAMKVRTSSSSNSSLLSVKEEESRIEELDDEDNATIRTRRRRSNSSASGPRRKVKASNNSQMQKWLAAR